jgi:transmembrane sensor
MSDEGEVFAVADDRWHQAVIWHAHHREASEAEFHNKMQAWKAWEADPENREVFDEVSRLLEDGSRVRKRRLPISGDTEGDAQEPPELPATWRPPPSPAGQRLPTRPTRWSSRPNVMLIAGAVVAVFAGLVITLPVSPSLWRPDGSNGRPQMHETALAEVRSDHLEDGSVVTLGARSAISVQFSAGHRLVTLDRGEAWFQVAHDVNRPFVVTAGARTITAVGTAFVVQKRADRVVVTVTDGTVAVAPQNSSETETPILPMKTLLTHAGVSRVARGEQFSYENSGSARLVENANSRAATAWSEGELEFDHMALREVVQVVNRYSRRTITVDESSGEQIFTGVVLQNQIDAWIRRLPDIYPVEILERGEDVCVRSRSNPTEAPAPCGSPH